MYNILIYILYIDIISFIYYIDILSIYTLIGFNWRDGKIFPVPWTLQLPKDTRERRRAVLQIFEGLLIDLAESQKLVEMC